jgi:hypothetical protein
MNNINVITSNLDMDNIKKDILEKDIKILINTDNSLMKEFTSILIDLNINRNGLNNFIKYFDNYENKYIKIFVVKNDNISLLIGPLLINNNKHSIINVISKFMLENTCYKSNSSLISNFINNNNINTNDYFV